MMPYRVTPYTDCIYPLKLHAYLASGKPVVGNPIRTLREFSDLVELATGVDEWSEALARVLLFDSDCHERAAERIAEARRHDWNCIAYQVARAIAGALGPDVSARLDALPIPAEWRQDPISVRTR